MFDRSLNTPLKHCVNHWNKSILLRLYELRRSRMNQVKFFTGCLLQILLCPMLNTLTHINQATKKNLLKYKNTSYIIKVNPSDKRFWRTSLKACAIFFFFYSFYVVLLVLLFHYIYFLFLWAHNMEGEYNYMKEETTKNQLKINISSASRFCWTSLWKMAFECTHFFSLPQSKQTTGDPR